MVSNGRFMLDRLMFYCVSSTPFDITVICVRNKLSVRPCISDDIVMHVIVKRDIYESICSGHKKNRFLILSRGKTGLGLLQCTRTNCHIKISRRSPDGVNPTVF